uniref:Small ribosomal subunit protein bS18c n=1 Tax=Stichococcus bacillaris TaxID=37433 RepID=A0A097KKH4_9CHLO|nr:ribosomal protein S18 [Stichococcus bacillaris]AIT93695.1 ribosomal protein S18 [Stichococcus bacillaris]|mmetsp:Transcript_20791/g.62605  ORF Transcript_20791/g.62605 Transcript_20791/m.62605 type:complete len:100 (+) Transcript_20791:205-504(+)
MKTFTKKPKSKFRKKKHRISDIVPLVQPSNQVTSILFRNTIDYKNVYLLKKCISVEGKILSRRITQLTTKQHRNIVQAIKNGRMLGIVPFIKVNKPFVN